MSSVSRNYASGLFMAAADKKENILAAMEEFHLAMKESAELQVFLLNPAVPALAKKAAVKQLLRPEAPANAMNFLYLLIDKRRMESLPDILAEYRTMVAKEANILMITVTSAQEMTGEQKDRIAAIYGKKYGAARVQVENLIDESLMGGLRIKIGDELTDDSISGRLRKLAAAISH